MPTSHGWSRVRVRVRQAVRGCVLEGDADAAARGVFDGLFGLVVEVVAHQAATGRCKGWVQRERAGVSMGTDIKANTRELVREVGDLLERLQRRVALETLCNRGSSFGTEPVVLKTAGVGFGGGR